MAIVKAGDYILSIDPIFIKLFRPKGVMYTNEIYDSIAIATRRVAGLLFKTLHQAPCCNSAAARQCVTSTSSVQPINSMVVYFEQPLEGDNGQRNHS